MPKVGERWTLQPDPSQPMDPGLNSGGSDFKAAAYDDSAEYVEPMLEHVRKSYNVTFHRDGGEIIGRLTWDDGTLHFEGNADESAQKFFEWVKQIVDPYIAERLAERQ